jgi:hypothetical protein
MWSHQKKVLLKHVIPIQIQSLARDVITSRELTAKTCDSNTNTLPVYKGLSLCLTAKRRHLLFAGLLKNEVKIATQPMNHA